jgi:hypothetical protein
MAHGNLSRKHAGDQKDIQDARRIQEALAIGSVPSLPPWHSVPPAPVVCVAAPGTQHCLLSHDSPGSGLSSHLSGLCGSSS